MSEACDACGSEYDYIYWLPDHVWERIRPLDIGDGGLLCLQCVHFRSKQAGIVLRFSGSDNWWPTDELTAAREENERVRLANLDVMNHYEDARDEAEKLRGRVESLGNRICRTCDGHGMIGGPSYSQPDEGGEPCPDCEASDLRRQAGAVDSAVDSCDFMHNEEFTPAIGVHVLLEYAQRLRQQAQSIENGE